MGAAASALRHRGRLQLDAGSVKAPFSRQKSRKIATVTKAPAKKSPAARNVVTHLLIPYRRRRCAAGRNPTPHGRTCGAAPTLRARPNWQGRGAGGGRPCDGRREAEGRGTGGRPHTADTRQTELRAWTRGRDGRGCCSVEAMCRADDDTRSRGRARQLRHREGFNLGGGERQSARRPVPNPLESIRRKAGSAFPALPMPGVKNEGT